MKNKILFGLVIAFVVANIVDIVTAMFILPGEANPLYLLTGSMVIPFILKVSIVTIAILVYRHNKYHSQFYYFGFIIILLLGSLIVSIGAYSNIYGILNPSLIEEATNYTTEEKIESYSWVVGLIYLFPVVMALIGFWIYDKTKKHVILREKEK